MNKQLEQVAHSPMLPIIDSSLPSPAHTYGHTGDEGPQTTNVEVKGNLDV